MNRSFRVVGLLAAIASAILAALTELLAIYNIDERATAWMNEGQNIGVVWPLVFSPWPDGLLAFLIVLSLMFLLHTLPLACLMLPARWPLLEGVLLVGVLYITIMNVNFFGHAYRGGYNDYKGFDDIILLLIANVGISLTYLLLLGSLHVVTVVYRRWSSQ